MQPVQHVRVQAEQVDHDFNFGANLFMLDEFNTPEQNAHYRDTFRQVFNAATLPFYWCDLEPEQGKPRFAADSPRVYRRPAPDLCLEYCEANGIRPKAHCLNYDVWTPLWVPQEVGAVKRLLATIPGCAKTGRPRRFSGNGTTWSGALKPRGATSR